MRQAAEADIRVVVGFAQFLNKRSKRHEGKEYISSIDIGLHIFCCALFKNRRPPGRRDDAAPIYFVEPLCLRGCG